MRKSIGQVLSGQGLGEVNSVVPGVRVWLPDPKFFVRTGRFSVEIESIKLKRADVEALRKAKDEAENAQARFDVLVIRIAREYYPDVDPSRLESLPNVGVLFIHPPKGNGDQIR
jgi:hypothetical protein